MDLFVDTFDEGDRLQVLPTAELVRDPLTRLSRVIAVEHRGDCVDSKSVDMILVEPEQGVAYEKVRSLGPAEVEDEGVPIRVEPLPGVGVLVEMCPIEI